MNLLMGINENLKISSNIDQILDKFFDPSNNGDNLILFLEEN